MPINFNHNESHSARIDSTYGDWRIDPNDFDRRLRKKYLKPYLTDSVLQTISFSQIGWKRHPDPNKRGKNCSCCDGVRYTNCDITVPGILAKNGPNPESKLYRMLDGKHRIEKMIDAGSTEAKFYVIEFDTIKHFFELDWKR